MWVCGERGEPLRNHRQCAHIAIEIGTNAAQLTAILLYGVLVCLVRLLARLVGIEPACYSQIDMIAFNYCGKRLGVLHLLPPEKTLCECSNEADLDEEANNGFNSSDFYYLIVE